jgi:uncharacterized RDD family membrane protein YckC
MTTTVAGATPALNLTPAAAACPSCGRQWGDGVACQFCGTLDGHTDVRLASVDQRLGAYLLDIVLVVFTLLVGWLVWSLIVWARGQTPGKQLLGLYCYKLDRGARATWGTMFVREFVGKGLIMQVFAFLTFGIAPLILAFRLCWHKNRQEVWDSVAGTVVVKDRP